MREDISEEVHRTILLASDHPQQRNPIGRVLASAGYVVESAGSFTQAIQTWRPSRFGYVLLEVSSIHAVNRAVEAALAIKRRDPRQFVAYLADPVLHASGLIADAIFPRNPDRLLSLLRGLASAPLSPGV